MDAGLFGGYVFSSDPQEKKLQLLIQKVSFINGFEALSSYYHPAIDYHLIRSYLRRGLIICKTKKAWDYINNVEANRTERTVAAIRMHCSDMINAVSLYTHLDISTINLIEWHIGRSVCMQEKADCKLETKSSEWLKRVLDTAMASGFEAKLFYSFGHEKKSACGMLAGKEPEFVVSKKWDELNEYADELIIRFSE